MTKVIKIINYGVIYKNSQFSRDYTFNEPLTAVNILNEGQ